MSEPTPKPPSNGLLRDTLVVAVGGVAVIALVASQVVGFGKLPTVDAKNLLADPGEGGRAAFIAMRAVQRGVFSTAPGITVRAGPITWRINPGENGQIDQWGGVPEDQQAQTNDLLPLRARRIYIQQPQRAAAAKVTEEQIAKLRAIEAQPDVVSPQFRTRAAELFRQRQTLSADATSAVAQLDEQLVVHVEQLSNIDLTPIRAKNAERAAKVREILSPEQLNVPPARRG